MKFGSKFLGFLQIAALLSSTLATSALAEADHASASSAGRAALGERPAACHAHGSNSLPDSQLPHSPRPVPLSYQCCLTGHDAAVVQASDSLQLSVESTSVHRQSEPALTINFLGDLEVSTVLSADPPGTTPLRI
jgi:hypothetical protein